MHEAEAWKARRYGRKTQRRGREGWKMRTYWRRDEKLQVFPTTQQSDQTEDSAAEDPLAPVCVKCGSAMDVLVEGDVAPKDAGVYVPLLNSTVRHEQRTQG